MKKKILLLTILYSSMIMYSYFGENIILYFSPKDIQKSYSFKSQPSFNELANSLSKLPVFCDIENITEKYSDRSGFQMKKLYQKIYAEQESKITKNQFEALLDSFIEMHSNGDLTSAKAWVKRTPLTQEFFHTNTHSSFAFKPYILGLKVKPGTKIHILGDRHGDARSTLQIMKDLHIHNSFKIQDNELFVSLGDITDRGLAGMETLYYLLRLKIENPTNCILVRGNHEDININERYGFIDELEAKFALSRKELEIMEQKISKVYDCLPVAAIVGSGTNEETNYMLFSHGGLDSRHNFADLCNMLSLHKNNKHIYCFYDADKTRLEQNKSVAEIIKNGLEKDIRIVSPYFNTHAKSNYDIDFMWSYLIPDTQPNSTFKFDGHRIFWGKKTADALLDDWHIISKKGHRSNIGWLFRAHQHIFAPGYESTPAMMNNLWDNNGVAQAFTEKSENIIEKVYEKIPLPFKSYYTVQVAPNNPFGVSGDQFKNKTNYPGFNYDTRVTVTTGKDKNSWTYTKKNVAMFEAQPRSIQYKGRTITPYLPYNPEL